MALTGEWRSDVVVGTMTPATAALAFTRLGVRVAKAVLIETTRRLVRFG